MKNWNNKLDYWATAITMMAVTAAVIALVDIATAWFGVEAVARTLGLQ